MKRYHPIAALSLLTVMVVSSIGCITPTDPYTITKPSADPDGSSFWDIGRSANVSESPFLRSRSDRAEL